MVLLSYLSRWFKPPALSPDYQNFLDTLSDVVLLINQSQKIEYVNHHWEEITGCSKKRTQGRYLADFLHPEDKSQWQQIIKKIAPNNLSQQTCIRVLGNDGEIRWCEMRIQSVRPNQLYPLSATLSDITPMVRQDQLKEANYRSLTGLVNRVPAMIYRARNDIDWTMEYVSDGCVDISGFSASHLLNKSQLSFGSLIHADDASRVWDEVQAALEEGEEFNLTYRLFKKNGRHHKVMDKGRGIYSDTGSVLGVEGVIIAL